MKDKAGSISKYITQSGERLWRYRLDGEPIDGQRNIFSKQGFKTRAAAMEAMWIAQQALAQEKAVPPPPPKETLSDWVRTWLRDYAPQRCTPKTIERYHQLAAYVLDAAEGEPAKLAAAPLAAVDHVLIEATLYALWRMPAKRREHLSAKTVREVAGVLSVSLNKAFRWADRFESLLRVELPKMEKSECPFAQPRRSAAAAGRMPRRLDLHLHRNCAGHRRPPRRTAGARMAGCGLDEQHIDR
jgi:hypothetical protein